MHIAFWITLLFLFNLLAYWVNKNRNEASVGDQSYHVYSIKKIKWNHHRFFKHDEFLFSPLFYPHLFHILLSYFSLEFLQKYAKSINLIVENLILVLSIIIIEIYLPSVPMLSFIPLAVCFVFGPYLYNHTNARNVGLNARNFGSLFTILFFIFTAEYLDSRNIVSGIFCSIMFTLTILSSQMGMQAILIGSTVLIFITAEIVLFAWIAIGAMITFFLTGDYFIVLVTGKLQHLKIYSRYLADIHILPPRPSIWLDFLHIRRTISEKGLQKSLSYYWTSPLTRLLWDFPFNAMVLYLLITDYNQLDLSNSIFSILSVLPLIIFLFISFRKTRFLGEPERYSEYFQIFSVLFLAEHYAETAIVWWICFGLTIIRLTGNLFISIHFSKANLNDPLFKIEDVMCHLRKNDIIATNNLNLTNPLHS